MQMMIQKKIPQIIKKIRKKNQNQKKVKFLQKKNKVKYIKQFKLI